MAKQKICVWNGNGWICDPPNVSSDADLRAWLAGFLARVGSGALSDKHKDIVRALKALDDNYDEKEPMLVTSVK